MAPRIKNAASSTRGARTEKRAVTGRRESIKQQPVRKNKGGRRRSKRGYKSKHKDTKGKLKGWLQTPADWARFTAWAKINAQPRKLPEPEPIVRGPAKPLYRLRRRLKVLALPREQPDLSVNCKEWTISRTALRVFASRRLILLALPNVRLCDYGRIYYKVSPAALNYIPSRRICELSQPRVYIPEECRPATLLCEKRTLDEERLKKLALAKKLLNCPQGLTPEEIAELFTPYGTKRTALEYKITSWVEFLALPTYKNIKARKDENAKLWKKTIIEEGEERGKNALVEYRKRIEKEKRKEKEKRMGRKRKHHETEKKKTSGGEGDKKAEEVDEKTKQREERRAKRRKIEKHAWRFVPHPCKDDPFSIKKGALKAEASPRTGELSKPNIRKNRSIKANPFTVSKGALSAAPSPRLDSLAKPNRPRSPIERKPPREKDKYGSPIFPMPVYGKRLPKTKPYKMGECPPAEEKKKVVEKRPIDPIAYEPTIDPCIYPDLARRQKKERKRAEKISKKWRRRKQKRKRRKGEEEKTDSQKVGGETPTQNEEEGEGEGEGEGE